ncbi:ATE1 Arginyl-tRNA--protein transferase 1 [Candida maltosa Xu316]|uniref:arginyltransferase n=1 Tax=Candida maltosa (strain Xu316) TaxID=1245528 RepID=M3K5H4_CANMX|nr:hypothetical protein G210_4966 [Candida maltosa Xu316]
MLVSIPQYISRSHCGYCDDSEKDDFYALESQLHSHPFEKKSVIIGSVAQFTCQEYDELMNIGYRRSGDFIYKSDLLKTCCRLYTIRTCLSMCKLTKEHRKVINRFIKEICPDLPPAKKNTFDLERLYEAQIQSTRFRTKFEPAGYSDEKFALYKKYQVTIHNDDPEDVSETSFERFLCHTPFPEKEVKGDSDQFDGLKLESWTENNKLRIGPTHECYYLDDKLIAISVIDFLPSGVSSVYFIWDPDYAYLSLGTLSGLKELQMCDKLGYDWYYLGLYVEDCPKMRYKQKFGGEILDLCNEVYFPFDKVNPFLANGRLFVAGAKGETYDKEFELESNGYPIDYKDSIFNDRELINIAEDIYGNDKVLMEAQVVRKILQEDFNIPELDSQISLPVQVPGIIPLWQILDWFLTGVLDDNFTVKVLLRGRPMKLALGDMTGEARSIVINFIRVFGLERTSEMLIRFQ